MRILRIEFDEQIHYAEALENGQLRLLSAAPWLGGKPTGVEVPEAGQRVLAPVSPSKILCVGRNYAAHAKELGNEVPKEPLLFLKPPSALCASGHDVTLPKASERVEYEGEIGIVIGTRLKDADAKAAREAIFGITVVNDVTARDLQKKDVQFTRAKGFDGFCPVGPHIETSFELDALTVVTKVNGAARQSGHVKDMVFPIAELVSFMSHVMTLEPGDLISTGTPEGVGPITRGELVEIEVAGMTLRNRFV